VRNPWTFGYSLVLQGCFCYCFPAEFKGDKVEKKCYTELKWGIIKSTMRYDDPPETALPLSADEEETP